MFQAVYDSPWHSPALYWLLGCLFLLAVLRRLPFLAASSIFFAIVVLADVLFTGALSPVAGAPIGGHLAMLFVLLGDLRFFLLLERYVRDGEAGAGLPPRALAVAAAFTLLVPLSANLPRLLSPDAFADPRRLFLTYELLFAGLALVLRLRLWPRRLRGCDAALRRWLLGLCTFQIIQYTGWAAADGLILGGAPVGYLVRLLPNAMYYGLFLPFAYFTAPPRLREGT